MQRGPVERRCLGQPVGVPGLGHEPIQQGPVIVIAPQSRIASGGHHLEHALGQLENGHIEGAATQIEHGIGALAGIVQPIGDGGSGGLVDQAHDMDAGHFSRILGGLALGIVKVGGHGDHRTEQIVVEGVFSPVAQRSQDFGTDFDGCLFASSGGHGGHAGPVEHGVRQLIDLSHLGTPPPHQAFDRNNGVAGILQLVVECLPANEPPCSTRSVGIGWQVAHHAGQNHAALLIWQTFGHSVTHGGHQ